MKINPIARAFGLTINQFAEVIGYTRQAFYEGIRNTPKAQEGIVRLMDLNDSMLEMEISEANRRYKNRKKAIDDFRDSLMECGRDG